ncbi:hypothetical protein Tco_1171500, partial [Tanacetum coccineum]
FPGSSTRENNQPSVPMATMQLSDLVQGGDTDPSVPAAGTIYALESMGLDVIEPWQNLNVEKSDTGLKQNRN